MFVIPLIHALAYGVGSFGEGDFGVGQTTTNSSNGSSGSSSGEGGSATASGTGYECTQNSDCNANQFCSNHTCYAAQCFSNSQCNVAQGETCLNYKCVKLFDMEILNFQSPVPVGEFFNFSYLIKAVAQINGDVKVDFWIQNKSDDIVTSGQDTFYMGSYDEKTKTKKLFLPEDVKSGTYTFYIQVTYGNYTASAYRTMGINVKNGVAKINIIQEYNNNLPYIVAGLSAIFILIGIGIMIGKRRRRWKRYGY